MITILAIQPEARQIGYAVFEDSSLIDWGTKTLAVTPLEQRIAGVAIPLVTALVWQHEPHVVVLPPPTKLRWTARNQFLGAIHSELPSRNLTVEVITREQIQACFRAFIGSERSSKDTIMHTIVKWFPELEASLPQPRKPWQSQDYWVPMFDAVSMAITWFHYND